MKKLCQFLYKRYTSLFYEFFVEEMVGQIPDSLGEPASEFLSTAGRKWEAWLLYQNYIIDRKASSEMKNSDIFLGMRLQNKLLMILATKKTLKMPKVDINITEEISDPFQGVRDFKKGFKPL